MELQSFRDYLGDGAGKHVLELGSGNGTLTTCLQGLGWTVDTVDIAFPSPARAHRHYKADIATGLNFLPNGATYDAVVSLAVLHHVVADGRHLPDQLAEDITAVTKPGGLIILQDVPAPIETPLPTQAPDSARQSAINTARIFADLVDPHSVPAHHGVYLYMQAISKQLAHSYSTITQSYHRCHWQFPNREVAARYVQALFHLDLPLDAVANNLAASLICSGNQAELPWALDCLVMRRL
jgi:SAM-dependent methyltransferase